MGGHSGIKGDLLSNSGTANNLSNQYSANALGIESSLQPQLQAEATNPQGYSPATMGAMTTAAEQTAGGGAAAGVGEAGLRANRTRNIGSGQAASAAADRGASQDLSQINAGLQVKNADLKAKQQQEGLAGEGALYGEDVGAGENALGLSTGALKDAGSLSNFWQQLMLQGVASGGQVAAAAAGKE
jgi:hypothetical protein